MISSDVLSSLRELRNVHQIGILFVDEKSKFSYVSYAELIAEAQRFAGKVRRKVPPGKPIILVMTSPRTAVTAILGCMIAQNPPTPIYPPLQLRGVPAFQNFVKYVAERSSAGYIISDSEPFPFLRGIASGHTSIQEAGKTSAFLESTTSLEITDPSETPVAFLQFTSGSTSTPKGVMVTHAGLQANLLMIRKAARMDVGSCIVTWLPVYHDMGLIGTVLNGITLPCQLVVLPPLLFLKHPRKWLEMITQFRGTHTAAPNFAYGRCVRRILDRHGLDLGSMTTFICGAEPVLPKTMFDFVSHFENYGLRPGAMVPAYGLAEATLAVTFSPHMRGLKTDVVNREILGRQGEALPPVEHSNSNIQLVSCGSAMEGLEVRVATATGQALPDRQVGEIQVRGSSVTPGYIGDSESTVETFTPEGWLKTGDLGYLVDGELYPCGRIKDVIIIRGRNYHAHDLESICSTVAGVRAGNVVAFSSPENGEEGLVIVAETREEASADEIAKKIRSQLAQEVGIVPETVLVIQAGTLPKTSSGKLKRAETRTLFRQGTLQRSRGKLAALHAVFKTGMNLLKKNAD
jgi:fatty-acyl-CoA synthase